MRVKLENEILFIDREDLPNYKKGGAVVRNSYFWALKSIAGRASRDRDWEFESEVWLALARMLMSFRESGYLFLSETTLEFPHHIDEIPEVLRSVSAWQDQP
ncbi:hypothetical protein [Pseudanabaena sp. PCC 6802]|uniref:hypothetical protein n=1 Tax=Pseudanabaena sp. PCC 6802 TaxID=118173 RepID=UPI0004762B7B|nr:hypothetical protein [Pseudanabaena sp. PCC 6802]